MKNYIIIVSLFIITSLLVIFIPSLGNDYVKYGKLYISEVLASNNKVIVDNYGNTSDYIEIYNGYNYDIDLSGYYLSDSEFDVKKWKFPSIKIASKSYLLIYASGLDTCDLVNNICHTNFKLSSMGEILTLTDSNGNIISKLKYPELLPDISYGYTKGKYILTDKPTPNEKNSTSKYNDKLLEDIDIYINEYMINNKIYYDKYGNYYDWVELYNNTNKNISLKDIYISDDIEDTLKHKLPDIVINSKDYIVIYFTEDIVEYEDGIYVNFGLSDKDKNIVISNKDRVLDKVDVVSLEENVSYGLKDNEWKYFLTPTPGYQNSTVSFDTMGGNDGNT